ncbi:hypothetical protein HK105_203124 [Polyrhizophydium stewartii]|uniref:Uncharacterized protein n=1 Tax=Polyrhizophydium stewartii TaxID=2732419 RepID=A0ABR4ND43_9FUNG
MPRISPARLQDPLFVIVLAIGLVTIAANVLVVASIIARIARGDRKAIRLRTGIATLNTIAAGLSILNTTFAYAVNGVDNTHFESLLFSLTGLGMLLMQLELWFTFTMLLSTDVRGTWTERGKTRARVAVVVAHLVLLGPEYVVVTAELPLFIFVWWTIGMLLNQIIVCVVSFTQSYVIISALLRRSKSLDAADSAKQHTTLIAALAGSVVAELCGIGAFLVIAATGSVKFDADYVWLAVHIIIISLGCKVVADSFSVSRMIDLVSGKQRSSLMMPHISKLMPKLLKPWSSKGESNGRADEARSTYSAPPNTVAVAPLDSEIR